MARSAPTTKSPAPKSGRPARLSKEAIVASALRIVRKKSLRDLTMRALAEELGATPMALYRHVGDSRGLSLLVVDAVFADLALPDRSLAPLAWLEELARAVRALGRAHRGVMDVLLEEGPAVPSTLVVLDAVVRKLHAAGLPWDEATGIHNTFLSWVAAAVRREERWAEAGERGASFERFAAAARAMATPAHPGLVAALPHMPKGDVEAEFSFSLAFMLGGVEARIAKVSRRGRAGGA